VSNTYNGNVNGSVIQVGSLYNDITLHGIGDSGGSLPDHQYQDPGRRLDDHKAAASAAVLLGAARAFYVDWPAPGQLPVLLGLPWRTIAKDDPIRPWAETIDSLRRLVGGIEHQQFRRCLGQVVEFLSVGAGYKRVFDKDQAFFLALAACDGGIAACEALVRYQPLPERSFAADFVTGMVEPSRRPLVETVIGVFADSSFRSTPLSHQDNPPQS
jgi:hypothetical protein